MPKGPRGQKRPADVIGNAVHVMRIATGEVEANCNSAVLTRSWFLPEEAAIVPPRIMREKNMRVRAIAGATLVAAVAASGASAQNAIPLEGPHAKMSVLVEAGGNAIKAPVDDKGLVTIFDNLAEKYPKGRYWCCEGYNIMGPQQGEQWIAEAFTPSANHTVTRIEVAAGWSQGPNGLVISINSDNSGVPGTALKSWKVSGLPVFGNCCMLVVNTDKKGVSLAAGQQYWVLLSTDASEKDTVDGWNVSDADQVDAASMATWSGGTWHTYQATPGVALAVKGSN